jgi:hypothetical protein
VLKSGRWCRHRITDRDGVRPKCDNGLGMLDVTDDSGYLALVDPDAYQSFIGVDWTLEDVVRRFLEQMAQRRLLIWATGLDGSWRVQVNDRRSAREGFRSTAGPITVTAGRLLLTNYESLTMAAQFEDERLPLRHELDRIIELPAADYDCHVVQLFDPDDLDDSVDDRDLDFVLEIVPAERGASAWARIPWDAEVGGLTGH